MRNQTTSKFQTFKMFQVSYSAEDIQKKQSKENIRHFDEH